MIQQTFDFDRTVRQQHRSVPETTSLPPLPAVVSRCTLTLVRPDRQLVYGGAHYCEWPAPDLDFDTITVDRIRDDIDGPCHRFVIKRGDTVEVFLAADRIEIGTVTDISHETHSVRVSFRATRRGLWVHKEQIYPVPKRTPVAKYRNLALLE